jgi:hypothetical protein
MDRASNPSAGLLGLLLRIGPELLAASTVLIAVAVALRRRAAAIPALLLPEPCSTPGCTSSPPLPSCP